MSDALAISPVTDTVQKAGDSDADRRLNAGSSRNATRLSRRDLLTGALCVGGALACTAPAQADILDTLKKFLYLDPIVLNYAHEMEELEADFFSRAVRSDAYSGLQPREQSIFNFIAVQDRAHFEALEAERERRGEKGGGHFETRHASASRQPRLFNYPREAFKTRAGLLRHAIEIKENVLWAYHGAVDLVRDPSLLAPAAAIAGVEGRHLIALRDIAGLEPVPTPFEGQVSPQKIGNRLARYGFKGGAMRRGVQ